MDRLLKYLSLEHFKILYVPEGGLQRPSSESSDLRIYEYNGGTFSIIYPSKKERQPAKKKSVRYTRLIQFFSEIGTETPVVVWYRAEAAEAMNAICSQYEKTDSALTGTGPNWLEVAPWIKTFFPALASSSFSDTVSFFQANASDPAQALGRLFLNLLEHVAGMEWPRLAIVNKFLQHNPSPERELFRKIQQYLKDHPAPDTGKPKTLPAPPSNKIGTMVSGKYQESIERIRPEEIREIFESGGLLRQYLDQYEERPEQLTLSLHIAEAFNTASVLLAEAGTGTGKSLAYLVPAILWSQKNYSQGETVVISTHTKNLQDQLFYKDLPLLEELFGGRFTAVLLKGRSNYLCLRKWKQIISEPSFYLTPAEREAALPVLFWLDSTQTGDLNECAALSADRPSGLWNQLASESGDCPAQKCAQFNDCFVRRVREEARKAHITVINHALLFSDIITENSIVGSYHNLILDEAHHIEKVAQNYLGMEFSPWVVKNLIGRLYERDKIETGLLIRMRQKIRESRLSDFDQSAAVAELDKTTEACVQLWQATQTLFQSLALESRKSQSSAENRNRNTSGNGRAKIRYQSADSIFKNTDEDNRLFLEACHALKSGLNNLLLITASWSESDLDETEDFRQQLHARIDMIEGLTQTFMFLTKAADANFVFWYELPANERSFDLRFYCAPLHIAEMLPKILFERLNTCILSSATLSVAGQFDYLKSRLGLNTFTHQPVHAVAVDSPFNYTEQARVFVTDFTPDPAHPSFTETVADLLSSILTTHRRGALVLFTSYALMQACYNALRDPLRRAGLTLLCQGAEASRTHLTRRFREEHTSVLLGTDSFWEGVDVPGEALELLVITKLPFEVPSDPLVAAKMERIQAAGGNPFLDYSVPEAVIKFRQGFGRLIRHKNDRGAVIITDNRLSSKIYGKYFIGSLPAPVRKISEFNALNQALAEFFP